MQTNVDFRSRVRAVRLESKSYLQAIRAERLARAREGSGSPEASTPVAVEDAFLDDATVALAESDVSTPDASEADAALADPTEASDVSPEVVEAAAAEAIPVAVEPAPAPVPEARLAVSALARRMSRRAVQPPAAPQPVETAAEVVEAQEEASDVAASSEAEDASAPQADFAEIAEAEEADAACLIEADAVDGDAAEANADEPEMVEVAAAEVEAEAVATADTLEFDAADVVAEACEVVVEAEAEYDPEPAAEVDEIGADPDSESPEGEAVFHLHSAAADDSDGQACDLETLPGAGPGLVWMLRRVGVDSLQDLAVADAVELQEKFGLIGQLIDMRAWIGFAQDKVAAQAG